MTERIPLHIARSLPRSPFDSQVTLYIPFKSIELSAEIGTPFQGVLPEVWNLVVALLKNRPRKGCTDRFQASAISSSLSSPLADWTKSLPSWWDLGVQDRVFCLGRLLLILFSALLPFAKRLTSSLEKPESAHTFLCWIPKAENYPILDWMFLSFYHGGRGGFRASPFRNDTFLGLGSFGKGSVLFIGVFASALRRIAREGSGQLGRH